MGCYLVRTGSALFLSAVPNCEIVGVSGLEERPRFWLNENLLAALRP